MRHAKKHIFKVDFWKKTMYQYAYKHNEKINNKNIEVTHNFIATLVKKKLIKNPELSYKLFENVDYDEILNFIKDTDLVSSGALTKNLMIDFVQLMKDKDCPLFKVALMGTTQRSSLDWEKKRLMCNSLDKFKANYDITLGGFDMGTHKRTVIDRRNTLYSANLEMGSGYDEKIFFTDQQQKDILEMENASRSEPLKSLSNRSYRNNIYRDYPILMIYPFNLSVINDDDTVTIPFSAPTIGYKLSFPDPQNMRGKTQEERDDLEKKESVSCLWDTVSQGHDFLQNEYMYEDENE